jgi:hypothetical protein
MFDSGAVRVNKGQLPGVEATYRFEEAATAYSRVASGTVNGKIAIVP